MGAIYRASAEILWIATRLGSDRDLPPPGEVRGAILGALREMVARCRAAGVPDAETAEARYAVVAFIDERILKSNWAGRAEWMNNPLQLQLYREYTAGENFFARMRALSQRSEGSAALEVYYLCLALGFTGAASASVGTHHAQAAMDAVRPLLPRVRPEAPLSPHALPSDHETFLAPRRPLVLALSVGCALLVVLGLVLLFTSLGGAIAHAADGLRTAASAAGAPR